MTEATRNELEAAGMVSDWRGIVALNLALRIDNSANETASGLVALVRQLAATLADVETVAAANVEVDDPLTRIRRIHAARELEHSRPS